MGVKNQDFFTQNPQNKINEKVERDKIYAGRFWESLRDQGLDKKKIQEMKEEMKLDIERMSQNGELRIGARSQKLTEEEKQKLSAIRVVAQEMDFQVGEFQIDEHGMVVAKIEKKPEMPNTYILRDICERCAEQYDNKYRSALFNINLRLEEAEVQEIEKLLTLTRQNLDNIVNQETLWKKFTTALKERRKVLGELGETSSIIEDPGTHDIQIDYKKPSDPKSNEKGVSILRVPPRIKHLYEWSLKLRDTLDTVEEYKKGLAKGRSAVRFGQNIKELYRFNKEVLQSRD